MNRNIISTSMYTPLVFVASAILLIVLSRIIPHPPNFTPIIAIAAAGPLFVRNKWHTLGLVAGSMVISDLLLGGFHYATGWVYASLMIITAISSYIKYTINKYSHIVALTVLSPVLFFIITNFGVWYSSGMYEHSLAGLFNCYAAAVPFIQNSLLGTMFYMGLIVCSYELSKITIKKHSNI